MNQITFIPIFFNPDGAFFPVIFFAVSLGADFFTKPAANAQFRFYSQSLQILFTSKFSSKKLFVKNR